MARDWALEGKQVVVTGSSAAADALRSLLAREGADISAAPVDNVDVLLTVPDILHTQDSYASDVAQADWQSAMNELFEGPRRITHEVLPGMQRKKSGRILHVIGSHEPMMFHPEYAAWGAMAAWSRSLMREIGSSGPTINLIQAGVFTDDPRANSVPAGRGCTADDIANLVIFLCSPYARYITGTIIPVDGGLSRFQH